MFRVFGKIRSMHWWRKAALAVVLVAVLYTCVGFLLVPVILKGRLEQDLGAALDRRVTVEDVDVNPLLLSLRVEGMRITEPDGSAVFASLAEGSLDLDFATLYRWYPIVEALSLKEPYVRLVRNEDGAFNLPVPDADPDREQDPGEPLRFAVHNIEIDRGEVRFLDRPSDREHVLEEIRLAVPFVSNAGEHVETWVEPSFSAVLNESGVSIAGQSKPFVQSRTTQVRLSLEGVGLPDYMVYVPEGAGLEITSGRLDLDASISFLRPEDAVADVEISADLHLASLSVEQPGKPNGLHLPSVRARIESLKPFHRTLTIGSVALEEPELRLHRNEAGAWTVWPGSGTTTPQADRGEEGWAVQLERASVEDGAFFFTDASVDEGFSFTLDPFHLDVRNLANRKGATASYAFSGAGEDGLTCEVEGEVTPVPFSSEGKAAVSGLTLPRYRPYYESALGLEIQAGRLDVDGRYRVSVDDLGPALELSEVGCRLDDLRAANGGDEEILRIPRLRVDGGRLSLRDRKVRIGSAAAKDGFVSVTRRKDGSLNVEEFVRTPEKRVEEDETASPWSFVLRKGTVENQEILFEDRQPEQPVQLRVSSIRTEVEGLTNEEEGEASVELRCRLDPGGSLKVSGTLDLVPLGAELAVKANDVGLPILQPYFDHPNLRLASADLSAAGDLAWSMEQSRPVVSYTGRSAVSGFSLVEKENGRELISCSSTELSGIDLGNRPARFHLGNLKILGLRTSVIISEKGRINLVQAFSRKQPGREKTEKPLEEPSAKKGRETSAETVRIETVQLEDGHISFRDDHIEPGVEAELGNIRGTVTGLSSEKGRRAEVNLQGNVTGDAPLVISGEVGALFEGLYVDVALSLKDAGMAHMNPYAKQYVGYVIEKGNLSLDLDYLIDRDRLDSRNRVLLDQLTLGEKVESAAAVDLPVKFAVALLKDRDGRINLSIPVKGDLSDPETDLGGVIRKAVLGFIGKVISAPFSFLGTLFGGGEELRYVAFPYGSSTLTAEAERKLRSLAQALTERPQLGVAIEGHVDPEEDGRVLAREMLLDELAREGETAGDMGAARVIQAFRKRFCKEEERSEQTNQPTPEEIRDLLAARDEKQDDGDNGQGPWLERLQGLVREGMDETTALETLFRRIFCVTPGEAGADLPVEALKELLASRIPVDEQDLRRLARDRARRVQRFLVEEARIGSERLYLQETSELSPDDTIDARKSRVSLGLDVR